MKMAVLLVVTPCTLVEVYRRFRGVLLIALMMEAANTSETSLNFYQITWCNSPEDYHFQPV
jgi:hypothetical protein